MPLDEVNTYVTAGYTMAAEGQTCVLTNPAYADIRVTVRSGGADSVTPDQLGGVSVESFGDQPVPGTMSGSLANPPTAVAYAPAKGSVVLVVVTKADGDYELLQINALDVLESVVGKV